MSLLQLLGVLEKVTERFASRVRAALAYEED